MTKIDEQPQDVIIMVAEEDSLPGRDEALGFYLRYDAKEVLGRGVSSVVRR